MPDNNLLKVHRSSNGNSVLRLYRVEHSHKPHVAQKLELRNDNYWMGDKTYLKNGSIIRRNTSSVSLVPARGYGDFSIAEISTRVDKLPKIMQKYLQKISGKMANGKITELNIANLYQSGKNIPPAQELRIRKEHLEVLQSILDEVQSSDIKIANLTKVYIKKSIEFLKSTRGIV